MQKWFDMTKFQGVRANTQVSWQRLVNWWESYIPRLYSMGSQPFVYTSLAIIMIILPLEFTAVGHAYACYQLIVTNKEGS